MELTAFESKYHQLLVNNELGGNESAAFKISHARVGKSGYSYGYMQWDYTAGRGRDTLDKIMLNAKDGDNLILTADEITKIKEKILKVNSPRPKDSTGYVFPTEYQALEEKLNKALSLVPTLRVGMHRNKKKR